MESTERPHLAWRGNIEVLYVMLRVRLFSECRDRCLDEDLGRCPKDGSPGLLPCSLARGDSCRERGRSLHHPKPWRCCTCAPSEVGPKRISPPGSGWPTTSRSPVTRLVRSRSAPGS